ncbi:MAG: toxin-antitoxin system YwqK family antitoxin [Kofleriaceae bacterium]
MPDVLAIVSKAVFEKEAKGLDVGDVWPTAAYTSTHAGLAPLASGGRLFLVTVRPEIELWLVGVLEQPRLSKGAWRAAPNTTPITDVTKLIPKILFASGKGLVRDAKLGMSLQSPREIAPATASLLSGDSTSTAASTKPALTKTTPAKPTSAKPTSANATPTKATPTKTTPAVAPPAKSTAAKVAILADRTAPVQGAIWNAADESWEMGDTDELGCRQGVWRSWREDGTPRGETPYVDHDVHGINRRFHPDGTLASEARWERGILRDSMFFGTEKPTDEPNLRQGGNATVRAEFIGDERGRTNVSIRFYDKEGRQRDAYGALVPTKRPAGVPDTARWFSTGSVASPDGSTSGWVDGPMIRERNVKCGVWRWWSNAGELIYAEVMTEKGKLQQRIRPGDDGVETEIDKFFADPKERYFYLAMNWTPFLHERMRARLATAPWNVVREYTSVLDGNIEDHQYVWSVKTERPREIIEIVEDWETRAPRDASDADAWFILGLGARSAFEIRDRKRTERWWTRFDAITPPKKLPEGTYAFNDFDDELGKSGEVRKRIEPWLSGKAAKAESATAKKLADPKMFASVDDDELAELVSSRAGARPCDVKLRNAPTCEAWLLDEDGVTHYWKGDDLAPTTVSFGLDELAHLMQSDACDERQLYWPGKHGWLALQRYGRSVLWHQAKFYGSRGQAEVEQLTFFKAGSPAQAQRLMKIIAGTKNKPVDPWEPPKLGPIFRIYKRDGIKSLAVKDKSLVTRSTTLEKFSSREAAILAFEKIELERIRTGGMIERFVAQANRD